MFKFLFFVVFLINFSFSTASAVLLDEDAQGNIKKCKRHRLCVLIDKGQQTMQVFGLAGTSGRGQKGQILPEFGLVKINTARKGFYTPTGFFSINEIAGKNRISSEFEGAPLYYALGINWEGIYIHGTTKSNEPCLGQNPRTTNCGSAGCIRTTIEIASLLNRYVYELNTKYGWRSSRVIVMDSGLQ